MTARSVAAILALAAPALCAAPAFGANQTVVIPHIEFEPYQVAIKPGETVTWDNQDDHEEHNVVFDDGSFTSPSPPAIGPWMISRTFGAQEGVFRYYCEVHGGPGGQGMSGVVYVNAAGAIPAVPPVASFTVSPGVATIGQSVTFNASASSDSDGTIAEYEWDLDGDGTYETSTGTTPTASRTYLSTATLEIRLRVTDSQALSHSTGRELRITAPPTAAFTATPGSILAGQSVAFDATGSSDPDGTIVGYSWDLDGDGSYETDTGGTPTASRVYMSAGAVTVGLQVTDSDGAVAATTRQVQVGRPAGTRPPAPTAVAKPVLPPAAASFATSKRTLTVSRSGRFVYGFRSTPGLSGSIRFASVKRVSTSARRRLSLGTKRFTVPGSGAVKVRVKLSRRNLLILKRRGRIRFRATVTLRNSADLTRSSSASLTLKKPRRR